MGGFIKVLGSLFQSKKGEGLGGLLTDARQMIKGKEADPDKVIDAVVKLAEAQSMVNAAEAGNRSIFVAGWRPFIGWIGGFALAYHWFVRDIVLILTPEIQGLPVIDTTEMYWLIGGMLGIGTLRTFEKIKGVTK